MRNQEASVIKLAKHRNCARPLGSQLTRNQQGVVRTAVIVQRAVVGLLFLGSFAWRCTDSVDGWAKLGSWSPMFHHILLRQGTWAFDFHRDDIEPVLRQPACHCPCCNGALLL